MFKIRLLLAVGAAGVLMALAMIASSSPAQAHQQCVSRITGSINRGYACNRYSGFGNHYANWVDGCDAYSDGYRVRAWAVIANTIIVGNWDPNGANPGCANDQYQGFHLQAHRICVEVVDCSNYVYHGHP